MEMNGNNGNGFMEISNCELIVVNFLLQMKSPIKLLVVCKYTQNRLSDVTVYYYYNYYQITKNR